MASVNDFLIPQRRGSFREFLRLAWWTYRTHVPINTLGLVSGFIQATIPALQAWIAKLVVDRLVLHLNSGQPLAEAFFDILVLVGLEFALVGVDKLLAELMSLLSGWAADRYKQAADEKMMRKSMSLDLAYFEHPAFLHRFERMRYTLTEIGKRAYEWCSQFLFSVWSVLSFAPLLLHFDWIIIALALITPIILFLLDFRMNDIYRARREEGWKIGWRANMMSRMSYFSEYAKEIRTFGLAEWLIEQFNLWTNNDRAYARITDWLRAGVRMLNTLLFQISYYSAYLFSIYQVLAKKISLGDLTMLMQSFRTLNTMISGLLDNSSRLFDLLKDVGEHSVYFGLSNTLQQTAAPGAIGEAGAFKELRLEKVWFRYSDKREWALEDVSLTIKAGEQIALVGENGSGKTTLTKLLLRLYDPTKGRITFNGIDIREFSEGEWRRQFSSIFQDWVRYDFNARENIQISDIEHPEESQLLDAAQKSGAHDVIMKLPAKYDAWLTRYGPEEERGNDLSTGEWQKIALARAFYRDAPILLLDEPTASVDAKTEYELYQYFKKHAHDKTLILISHRFSSVRFANRIYLLDKGKLTEEGTHGELVKLGGKYAEMFRMQMEGLGE